MIVTDRYKGIRKEGEGLKNVIQRFVTVERSPITVFSPT